MLVGRIKRDWSGAGLAWLGAAWRRKLSCGTTNPFGRGGEGGRCGSKMKGCAAGNGAGAVEGLARRKSSSPQYCAKERVKPKVGERSEEAGERVDDVKN